MCPLLTPNGGEGILDHMNGSVRLLLCGGVCSSQPPLLVLYHKTGLGKGCPSLTWSTVRKGSLCLESEIAPPCSPRFFFFSFKCKESTACAYLSTKIISEVRGRVYPAIGPYTLRESRLPLHGTLITRSLPLGWARVPELNPQAKDFQIGATPKGFSANKDILLR